MRVVLQRVSEAAVTIDGIVEGTIENGILVLVGITEEDGLEDIEWISKKILQLRIFNDSNGQMNKSVQDINGDLMVISQFTLFAKTKKGNRPSYIRAARPEVAIPIYEQFKTHLSNALGRPVASGKFGADMKVSLINDGPVTISIDSHHRE